MVMRSWRWERRMNFDRMRSLRAAFDLTSHVWVETHAAPIYRFPYLEHTHTHAHTHTHTHTHTHNTTPSHTWCHEMRIILRCPCHFSAYSGLKCPYIYKLSLSLSLSICILYISLFIQSLSLSLYTISLSLSF